MIDLDKIKQLQEDKNKSELKKRQKELEDDIEYNNARRKKALEEIEKIKAEVERNFPVELKSIETSIASEIAYGNHYFEYRIQNGSSGLYSLCMLAYALPLIGFSIDYRRDDNILRVSW
jgi:hypothetical protein